MKNLIPTTGQNKLASIKRILVNENKRKAPRYFEAFVDELKVIPKTNDVKQFDDYEEFIYDNSKTLLFKLYTTKPNTSWCEKHLIELCAIPLIEQTNGVNGIDEESLYQERYKIERERWEAEQVKKELDETKIKLKEEEEYSEKLEKIIEELRNKKPDIDYSSLIVSVLTGFVKENPDFIANGLAGFTNSKKENQKPTEPEEENFTKIAVNAWHLKLITILKQQFSPEDLDIYMEILSKIIDEPPLLHIIADLLNIKKN